MFSNWFSGDECGQYRTSPYKQRMDHVGSSLLELRYANEVVRQHLHEWLRFFRHLEERGMPVTGHRHRRGTAVHTSAYVEDECQPLPCSPSLCQNLPLSRAE